MAKTTTEKIESVRQQISQLENLRKRLLQEQKEQERKARTKRLIERGALLESMIVDAPMLSNAQIKSFLEKTVKTDFARRVLSNMGTTQAAEPAEQQAGKQWRVGVGMAQTEGGGVGQAVGS